MNEAKSKKSKHKDENTLEIVARQHQATLEANMKKEAEKINKMEEEHKNWKLLRSL